MGKHHVTVSQLSIEVGGNQPRPAPYMNVVAKDYEVLGVLTHGHGQLTFLFRDKRGFIGLYVFPTIAEFNAFSERMPGNWQEVEMLK